jgi:hypothetical protein
MEPETGRSLDAIIDVVASESDIAVGMRRLLDHCARLRASAVWERISLVDFTAGGERERAWLEALLKAEPPGDSVEAFWFGIFDGGGAGEEEEPPIAELYLAGSEVYEPDDPTAEWACSPEYFPQGRYAHSALLREMSELLNGADAEAFEIGAYVLPLGYAGLTAAEACRKLPRELLLGARAERAVAAGFDSGDFLTLPAIRRG